MVLDASLLNTQHYKVRIKGKVEQSRKRSITLPYNLGVVANEKGDCSYQLFIHIHVITLIF